MNVPGRVLLCCLLFLCAPASIAAELLPKILTAAELTGAGAVHFQTLGAGQVLELIGFESVAPATDQPSAEVRQFAPGHHQLRLPESVDHLALEYVAGDTRGNLHLYPWIPLRGDTRHVGHYALGVYPPVADKGQSYAPPAGLIKVTRDNWQQPVSASFRLGQFLCKQQPSQQGSEWPKFVALKPSLLRKLELLLQRLKARGVAATTLHVMSGYRTPEYNRGLGNVAYSRHVYGDAADVFVDVDGDARMDDLNGDGRSDVNDALWLLRLLETPTDAGTDTTPLGGLSAYPANAHHGPFLHVDTRGSRARWGYGL